MTDILHIPKNGVRTYQPEIVLDRLVQAADAIYVENNSGFPRYFANIPVQAQSHGKRTSPIQILSQAFMTQKSIPHLGGYVIVTEDEQAKRYGLGVVSRRAKELEILALQPILNQLIGEAHRRIIPVFDAHSNGNGSVYSLDFRSKAEEDAYFNRFLQQTGKYRGEYTFSSADKKAKQ